MTSMVILSGVYEKTATDFDHDAGKYGATAQSGGVVKIKIKMKIKMKMKNGVACRS